MEIIPAIDIMDGKCVRLKRGKFGVKKIYSEDPLKVALSFQKAGCKKLHLVDLDGAREGDVKNWGAIEKIARRTYVILQIGGGFRREKDLKRLFALGPHKVILGTVTALQPVKFKGFLQKFGGEKIIADIALKKDKIFVKGWQKAIKRDLFDVLRDFIAFGVKTVICTDIEKDGTLRGPNFSLYKRLISKYPKLEIIASGGITTMRDLRKLSKIGVAGAVVGKAFYEKKISLKELASPL